jgi:hypothetical protein
MGGGSSDDIPKTKRGRALHDATHGQFGEEPHAGPRPGGEEERPGREKEGRGGESGPAAERVKKAREQSREA